MQKYSEWPDRIILDISSELSNINVYWSVFSNQNKLLTYKTEMLTQVIEALSDKNKQHHLLTQMFSLDKNQSNELVALNDIYHRLKCDLGIKIKHLDFSQVIKADNGFFNYFFENLYGNKLVIKRLT